MKFSSAAAVIQDVRTGLGPICDEAAEALGKAQPDLVVVFVTSHFEDESETLRRQLIQRFPRATLIGCSAEGVIGAASELERTPALALMLGSLPGARLRPFFLPGGSMSVAADEEAFVKQIGASVDESASFFFFGDPYSLPVNAVLERFGAVYRGRPVLGGMASGCEAPDQAVLLLGDQVHRSGGVGLAVSGAVDVRTVVSQGCRPIGRPLIITRCKGNVILDLGGVSALTRLREIVEALPPDDAKLINRTGTVFVGRVIDEYKESFVQGDFLIRNLIGIDSSSGALAVGEEVRVGATVQFHLRDGASADQDMRHLLKPYANDNGLAGALLFSCNGRGTRMWDEPNHDVSVLREVCGPVPVAGFFAAGEIGPVGGKNFIHGHTASMALFRPPAT